MTEERIGASKGRSKEAAQSLRYVFERVWPVDRKPVFSGLVRAIDKLDREQRRRRKHRDAADRLAPLLHCLRPGLTLRTSPLLIR